MEQTSPRKGVETTPNSIKPADTAGYACAVNARKQQCKVRCRKGLTRRKSEKKQNETQTPMCPLLHLPCPFRTCTYRQVVAKSKNRKKKKFVYQENTHLKRLLTCEFSEKNTCLLKALFVPWSVTSSLPPLPPPSPMPFSSSVCLLT